MKKQMKHAVILLSAACLSGLLTTGCSSSPAPDTAASPVTDLSSSASDNTGESVPVAVQDDAGTDTSAPEPVQDETDVDDTEGKWHVLPPDVAAAVDADFSGEICKIEEDTFYIMEEHIELLEDGTILSSSPSSDAVIPESEFIPVVHDGNTHFYLRTIHGNGETYEDTEASFHDLELHLSVELKGCFKNDVFYADEVRIVKVS